MTLTDTKLRNAKPKERPSPEIVEMILAIEARGAEGVARRGLQSTNSIFRYKGETNAVRVDG